MRLPHPFRSPLLGTSFRWLLWSGALIVPASNSIVTALVPAAGLSQTLGPALAGVALVHWSVRTLHGVFGLLSAASSLGFFPVPSFRHFMALGHDEVDNGYSRNYSKVFEGAQVTQLSRWWRLCHSASDSFG
jgi:hypothetical protein